MPERPLGVYAPFEHVTRVQAVRDFVDWLYDHGPDPTMPREQLLERYWDRVATEALQAAADAAHERADERHDEVFSRRLEKHIANVVQIHPPRT